MILKAIIFPDKYLKKLINDKFSGWEYFFKYAFTFSLIGPVLSFYSLITQLKYSIENAFLYSITTYIIDLLVVILFSYFVFIFFKIDFNKVLKFYIVVNIPIWLSDVFDIYQPLRVLTNIGLIYSFYILYRGIKEFSLKNYFPLIALLHTLLYVLDAVISESIATNPILLNFIKIRGLYIEPLNSSNKFLHFHSNQRLPKYVLS